MHGNTNKKLLSTCFEQVIVHHQQLCTSNLQYFTMHLKRCLVTDTIRMIIRIVSAVVCILLVFFTYEQLYSQSILYHKSQFSFSILQIV